MPLRLEIKKELSSKSDRVKSVDIHTADRPWVLCALYNGNVFIWDYTTNTLLKSFELCEVPVRCARFISRKQWFIAGTDDMHLRVYNYNTMEKVKEWEAHTDYIRYLEVHPNRPYVLSSSDDMSIKLWDWENNWDLVRVFEGHVHYVMMVRINPRDTNTFASASLDRTIRVWGLTANVPHFSLEGPGAHDRGVNCLDYYPGGDKPYLLSGADDRTVKIWDYQTKACLQTLEGHSHNVSAVCFHPRLPLIVSASEDGTVRLWHSTTYRPETTLNYGMERAWCLAPTKDANKLAIGFDEGTVVLKLGKEKPIASLDVNTGKLVWALTHDIQTMSLRGVNKDGELQDGDKIPTAPRDLGACEVYPQNLAHNSNGAFIVVCGDGEYIIYTSQSLRNKAYGSALEFVWSSLGTGDFAIRESSARVRIFKNFKEHRTVELPMASADRIFGGNCLGVQGPDCIVFFDWEQGEFIRKIDVAPSQIFWNEVGDSLVLVCEDSYYVLKYDRDVVQAALAGDGVNPEEGVDGSFELDCTINDTVRTGQWVGDCFLYTNGTGKLHYFVGGEVITLCHLATHCYLLGYVPKEDRVFLIDKSYNVVSYRLLLSVLNYQTAVVRRDFDTANSLLTSIPQNEYNSVARFLESQGFKEEALNVSRDADHRFELAIDLKNLDVAHSVLQAESSASKEDAESTEMQNKWRRLGDLALASGNVELAQNCATRSADLSGLLLLHASTANKEGMKELAIQARDTGRANVAFLAYFVTGQVEECIQLLVDTKRVPEAAFMARTYMPSKMSEILALWKSDLKAINEKAADALADPQQYPNLFPDLEVALKVEEMFFQGRDKFLPAASYPEAKEQLHLDLCAVVRERMEAGESVPEFKQEASVSEVAEEPVKEAMKDLEPAVESEPEAEPVSEPAVVEPEPVAEPVVAAPEPEKAPAPAAAVESEDDEDLLADMADLEVDGDEVDLDENIDLEGEDW